MKTKKPGIAANLHDLDLDEELSGILNAISIVSKRLAKKLLLLQKRDEPIDNGGEKDE
jgi:hypothetical protein